jgi:hypothetical protein
MQVSIIKLLLHVSVTLAFFRDAMLILERGSEYFYSIVTIKVISLVTRIHQRMHRA